VGTSIRLLGPPAIVRDGQGAPAAAPKGQKSWGLLAYLLLSERPVARRQLAELLFADADDPLGALRWSLAQLRRALGGDATLEGDPIGVVLDGDVVVDALSGVGDGELLEGLDFSAAPAFDAWLVVARGRFAGRAVAALREAALDALAGGDTAGAAERAARLVAVDPFEEGHHELLVRCLAAGGDRAGALAAADACGRLFRRELGREPSAAVRRAAAVADGGASGDDRGRAAGSAVSRAGARARPGTPRWPRARSSTASRCCARRARRRAGAATARCTAGRCWRSGARSCTPCAGATRRARSS
jgi:DNA-binding SARP family transcriptional activator